MILHNCFLNPLATIFKLTFCLKSTSFHLFIHGKIFRRGILLKHPPDHNNLLLVLTLRKYLMFLLWKSPGGSNRYRSSSHKSRRKPENTTPNTRFTRKGQRLCVRGFSLQCEEPIRCELTFLILTWSAHHVSTNLPLHLHFSLKERVHQLLCDVPCSEKVRSLLNLSNSICQTPSNMYVSEGQRSVLAYFACPLCLQGDLGLF